MKRIDQRTKQGKDIARKVKEMKTKTDMGLHPGLIGLRFKDLNVFFNPCSN